MEELEGVEERLENVRAVLPILGVLRTISLGSWRAALRHVDELHRYSERLLSLLPPVLSALPRPDGRERRVRPSPGRSIVVVVGSERGLCGRFNTAVIEYALDHLAARPGAELGVLGGRAFRLLTRRGRRPAWGEPLAVTSLPPLRLAFDLTRRWLAEYEAFRLDSVDVIHNRYESAGRYTPQAVRLIPPSLEAAKEAEAAWPPPIVETDPLRLYGRLVEQWAATRLYGLLLDSAVAEHSARFQLMEGAIKNAGQLIEELTIAAQSARRQAITREVQELALGAGLVGPRRS